MQGVFCAGNVVYRRKKMKVNTGGKEQISGGTPGYEKLSRRALHCMYTADIIVGVALLVVIGAADYFWLLPEKITAGVWISVALAALILLDIVVSPYFRYHRYRYSINEECIDIVEGYLFVSAISFLSSEGCINFRRRRGLLTRYSRWRK